MAKIGIYIPDAKAPEVEEWKNRLNLSEIFREAFDKAVHEARLSEMGGDEMENVVKRLRQDEDESYQAGKDGAFESGVTWAKEDASLSDLRGLCNRAEEDWQEWADQHMCRTEDSSGEVSPGETLLSLLRGDGGFALSWEEEIDRFDRVSFLAGFFDGFVEGASSIWAQVCRNF